MAFEELANDSALLEGSAQLRLNFVSPSSAWAQRWKLELSLGSQNGLIPALIQSILAGYCNGRFDWLNLFGLFVNFAALLSRPRWKKCPIHSFRSNRVFGITNEK